MSHVHRAAIFVCLLGVAFSLHAGEEAPSGESGPALDELIIPTPPTEIHLRRGPSRVELPLQEKTDVQHSLFRVDLTAIASLDIAASLAQPGCQALRELGTWKAQRSSGDEEHDYARRTTHTFAQPGAYLIESRTSEKTHRTLIIKSDIAVMAVAAFDTVLAYCVDAVSGIPVAGARIRMNVQIVHNGRKVVASFIGRTDRNGTFSASPVRDRFANDVAVLTVARHGPHVAYSYASTTREGEHFSRSLTIRGQEYTLEHRLDPSTEDARVAVRADDAVREVDPDVYEASGDDRIPCLPPWSWIRVRADGRQGRRDRVEGSVLFSREPAAGELLTRPRRFTVASYSLAPGQETVLPFLANRPGCYQITAQSGDQEARAEVWLTSGPGHVPCQRRPWLGVTPDRRLYRPRGEATVVIAAPLPEIPLLFVAEGDDLYHYQFLRAAPGAEVLRFTLDEELPPTLHFSLYAYGGGQLFASVAEVRSTAQKGSPWQTRPILEWVRGKEPRPRRYRVPAPLAERLRSASLDGWEPRRLDSSLVPPLMAIVRSDASPEIRAQALKVLADIGDQHVAPSLVPLAEEEKKAAVKAAVVEALNALGYRLKYDLVLSLLKKRAPEVKLAALSALRRAAPIMPLKPLVKLLDHKDPRVGAKAATLLGKSRDRRAVKPLTEAVQADRITPHALLALAELNPVRAKRLAKDALNHPHPRVRLAALQVLAKDGDEIGATHCMMSLLGDDHEKVRVRATRLLGELTGSDSAVLLISQVGKRTDPPVMLEAFKSAARRKLTDAVPVLLEAVADEDEQIALAAIEALRQMGQRDPYAALYSGLSARHVSVRIAAVRALVQLGDRRIVYQFGRMLRSDPSPAVRREAALALGRVGGADVVDRLVVAMSKPETHSAARGALFRVGVPAVPRLRELLLDHNPLLRAGAIGLLGELRGKEAREPLQSAVGDRSRWARREAALALGRLTGRMPRYEWQTGRMRTVPPGMKMVRSRPPAGEEAAKLDDRDEATSGRHSGPVRRDKPRVGAPPGRFPGLRPAPPANSSGPLPGARRPPSTPRDH